MILAVPHVDLEQFEMARVEFRQHRIGSGVVFDAAKDEKR